jgi:hypothetical protein
MRHRRKTLAVAVLIAATTAASWAEPPHAAVNVRVVNQPTVRARLAPTRHPFQRGLYLEVPSGSLSASAQIEVPAGQRLVLEWVSGSTRVDDWELARFTVTTTVGTDLAEHEIAPTVYRRSFEGSDPPLTPDFVIAYSQRVQIYADPGTQVTVRVLRSENHELTPTGFLLSLSGYLIDCGDDPGCAIP